MPVSFQSYPQLCSAKRLCGVLQTPLWPAGHLPLKGALKGGDWLPSTVSPVSHVISWRKQSGSPISPLEGEMSGRTEGGSEVPSFVKKRSRPVQIAGVIV